MSYYRLVQLAKTVGFKEGDTLYYAIPGRSLDDAGIDHLKDDASVCDKMKYSNQAKFLEVYIKHNEKMLLAPIQLVMTRPNKSTLTRYYLCFSVRNLVMHILINCGLRTV